MKRALIFSDSHGRIDRALEIIRQHPEAEAVFHCGDVMDDADRLRRATPHPVAIVRGNGDYGPGLPQELVTVFAGKKFAMCHGHRHHVYGGMETLRYWGLEREADVVLFGHTHIPFVEQSSTLTLINPGSITRPRQADHRPSYAVVDIDTKGELKVRIQYLSS